MKYQNRFSDLKNWVGGKDMILLLPCSNIFFDNDNNLLIHEWIPALISIHVKEFDNDISLLKIWMNYTND